LIDKDMEIERLHAVRSQELADAVDGERDRWLHDYSIQADRILAQAKEIERLRAENAITDPNIALIRHCLKEPHSRQQGIDAFNAAGFIGRMVVRQKDALKKLGAKYRTQVKRNRFLESSLIDERQHYLKSIRPGMPFAYNGPTAREQLHTEGKL
jgi:hypothetical protein